MSKFFKTKNYGLTDPQKVAVVKMLVEHPDLLPAQLAKKLGLMKDRVEAFVKEMKAGRQALPAQDQVCATIPPITPRSYSEPETPACCELLGEPKEVTSDAATS